ncbi:hypothetical protein GCM10022631_27210 [Deinococcus rubellus]
MQIPKNLLYFSIRYPQFLHQADDLWTIYKCSTCAVERRRSQLLALLCEGKSYAEVLAITHYSYQGADKIACRGRCYEFLDAVAYSQQVLRPRHAEADQQRQDDFKKILPEAV